jgi:hypothetical protein
MRTLQYQPGAAYMCDDKRALPILAQLAGGAEPLRPPRVGALISLPKSGARSSAARSSPGRAIVDHLVPAFYRTSITVSASPVSSAPIAALTLIATLTTSGAHRTPSGAVGDVQERTSVLCRPVITNAKGIENRERQDNACCRKTGDHSPTTVARIYPSKHCP